MTDPRKTGSDRALARLPIHKRIRRLREEKRLAAYELAKRAGISPSYLSLIESGEKVPSEEAALRIARALGDDPELYRGWSHAGGREGLARLLGRLRRYASYSYGPAWGRAPAILAKVDDDGTIEAALDREAGRIGDIPALFLDESSLTAGAVTGWPERDLEEVVEVPVLEEGTDPGDDPTTCGRVVEMLRFDPRVLPAGDLERPFAYRPGEAMLTRVRDMIHPGDLVVLSGRMGALSPDSVHAVRFRDRTIFSRVLFKGNALLLLPPAGSSDFEQIDLKSRKDLSRNIVGTVALTVRAWRRTEDPPADRGLLRRAEVKRRDDPDPGLLLGLAAAAPRAMQSVEFSRRSPRRGAKIEEGFLIRDCDWRDKYGWRPIQRAEDLDTLEEHPGMRIRYRLIRDERVLYHLEMGPEEWREALGDYVDGPTWRKNGYVTAITRMHRGRYTMEFKERWAPHVTRVAGP